MIFSVQDEEKEKVYTVVGFVTMTWAYLEMCIDQTNTVIFHYCDGNKVEKELPVTSLKKKLKFQKLAFNQLPNLAGFKTCGLALAEKVRLMSDRRHHLIHGAAVHYDRDQKITKFVRFRFKDQYPVEDTRDFKLTDLMNLGTEIQDLALEVCQFSNDLVQAVVQQEQK